MDNSPLNRLPGEIRNHIYELSFCGNEPIELGFETSETDGAKFYKGPTSPEQAHSLAALRTCKQFFEEARSIALSNTSFVLHAAPLDAEAALKEFAKRVGAGDVHKLKAIKIDIGTIRGDDDSTGFFRGVLVNLCERAQDMNTKNITVSFSPSDLKEKEGSRAEMRVKMPKDKKTLASSIAACSTRMMELQNAQVGRGGMAGVMYELTHGFRIRMALELLARRIEYSIWLRGYLDDVGKQARAIVYEAVGSAVRALEGLASVTSE